MWCRFDGISHKHIKKSSCTAAVVGMSILVVVEDEIILSIREAVSVPLRWPSFF